MFVALRRAAGARPAVAPRASTQRAIQTQSPSQGGPGGDEGGHARFMTLFTWGSFFVCILGGAALGILQWRGENAVRVKEARGPLKEAREKELMRIEAEMRAAKAQKLAKSKAATAPAD